MRTTWDRYNKIIVAINSIDIAVQHETDQQCLHLADAAQKHLRDLAKYYLDLTLSCGGTASQADVPNKE